MAGGLGWRGEFGALQSTELSSSTESLGTASLLCPAFPALWKTPVKGSAQGTRELQTRISAWTFRDVSACPGQGSWGRAAKAAEGSVQPQELPGTAGLCSHKHSLRKLLSELPGSLFPKENLKFHGETEHELG